MQTMQPANRDQLRPQICPICDYDLTGLPHDRACPDCGLELGGKRIVFPCWTPNTLRHGWRRGAVYCSIAIIVVIVILGIAALKSVNYLGLPAIAILVCGVIFLLSNTFSRFVRKKLAPHTHAALISDDTITLEAINTNAYGPNDLKRFKDVRLRHKVSGLWQINLLWVGSTPDLLALKFLFAAKRDDAELIQTFIKAKISNQQYAAGKI